MQLNFAVELDQSKAEGLLESDIQAVHQMVPEMVATALSVRPDRRGAMREQLVALLVGEVALTPLDMKRARLEAQALRSVRSNSEWLTAAEIAELANLGPANPIGTVSRWKQQGRIFALREGSKDFYPKYALGPDFHPLPAIKEILAVLTGYDTEMLATWFDSTSRFLGGKRPRELVATESARVLEAARNMIEVQEHHG